jgi:hypothetical protein
MKKPGSHVSSEKAGRKRKAGAPNARSSRGSGGRLDPEVERWFATAGVVRMTVTDDTVQMGTTGNTADKLLRFEKIIT